MDLNEYTDNNLVDDLADEVDEFDEGDVKLPADETIMITTDEINERILNRPKKSIPYLNKYEKARIFGLRLQQLADGAKPCVDTTGLKNIHEIVQKEYSECKMPFIIVRSLPNGEKEYWKLEEFKYLS
jgi:DNA-directed RNA polymerase I, II, and III subunit RPABC2